MGNRLEHTSYYEVKQHKEKCANLDSGIVLVPHQAVWWKIYWRPEVYLLCILDWCSLKKAGNPITTTNILLLCVCRIKKHLFTQFQ